MNPITSAMAQLLPGQGTKNAMGTTNAITIRNALRGLDILNNAIPIIRMAIAARVKKQIDEIKWASPVVSGNTPTPANAALARIKMSTPTMLSFVLGRIPIKNIPKMIDKIPAMIRPLLNIMAGVPLTPRSLRQW